MGIRLYTPVGKEWSRHRLNQADVSYSRKLDKWQSHGRCNGSTPHGYEDTDFAPDEKSLMLNS